MRIDPVSIHKEFDALDGSTIFLSLSIAFSKKFRNSHLMVEETGAAVKYCLQS